MKEFLIQNKNVTKAEYQKFLNENPKWTLNNKDNLIKKELVDESYLKTFKQMSSNEDITHISYHAAIEYARWYSSNLPKGFKARLPISQEWELYQKEVPKAIESLNINEISKKVGFWNLMQNSSFNESFLFQDTNDIYPENSNFNSLITEIRTYNYNNNPTLKPSTKASFLKHWCSPNIGFRIVIEKE
nr:SUMF1/EgtB/PvdO family nonheme iron enzyme [Borrelia coriaceae]